MKWLSELTYNKRTGILRRSVIPVGTPNSDGYLQVRWSGVSYKVHRLIFLVVTGAWPTEHVDHRNGVRSDNRWRNLRDVSGQWNTHNQRNPRKDNRSGYLGVSWHKPSGKWVSKIGVEGKRKFLGYFTDPAVAHQAYLEAKRRLHAGCTI